MLLADLWSAAFGLNRPLKLAGSHETAQGGATHREARMFSEKLLSDFPRSYLAMEQGALELVVVE